MYLTRSISPELLKHLRKHDKMSYMTKNSDTLTFKEKKFTKEYIKTEGNGTEAILRVYDTEDKKVAGVMAVENLAKPRVQEELRKLLSKDEYALSHFTSKLASISAEEPVKGYVGADIIKANEIMLKLHGVLTDRKQVTSYNINADLSKLSEHELRALRDKKRQETDSILQDP